jgi:D-glycero-alpha-D-manno-heptose 1-phosphate guanylyltransferase
MEVIILAGGMGTRVREVLADLPKPMAQINGKPFLHYLFEWLTHYPVKKFILSVGYKAECIINYFESSYNDIPIEYSIEEKPLGTGGAIMYALQNTTRTNVIIVNGDTYFPIDINRFYDLHFKKNYLLSIALKPMCNFDRYGSVECNGDTIIRFNEKKMCTKGLINGGIYLVNKQFFEKRQFPEVFSFEREVLEKEAGSSNLKGLIFDNKFIDIGIPEDLYKAGSFFFDKLVNGKD